MPAAQPSRGEGRHYNRRGCEEPRPQACCWPGRLLETRAVGQNPRHFKRSNQYCSTLTHTALLRRPSAPLTAAAQRPGAGAASGGHPWWPGLQSAGCPDVAAAVAVAIVAAAAGAAAVAAALVAAAARGAAKRLVRAAIPGLFQCRAPLLRSAAVWITAAPEQCSIRIPATRQHCFRHGVTLSAGVTQACGTLFHPTRVAVPAETPNQALSCACAIPQSS